jgi:Zn-dependent metalloprotease
MLIDGDSKLMSFRSLMLCVLIAVSLCQIVSAQPKRGAGRQDTGDFGLPPSRSWFGELSEPYSNVSESTARVFLSSNALRFGLDPALPGLTLVQSGNTPMGAFFRFQQSYQAIPVYGAEVKLNFNREGRVVAVNSSYVLNLKIDSTFPKIGPDQARGKLEANVPKAAGEDSDDDNVEPKLYIVISKGTPVLAWEVVRHSGGAEWKALVHAGTGALLSAPRDANRYATGTGRVFNVNAVVATRNNSLQDNNDTASAVPPIAYTTVGLLRLVGTGYLDGSYASSSATKKRAFNSGNAFLFDRSSDGFSETMAYYYLDYAQTYIQSLGFNNVNNRQQIFAVNRLKQDNSFYSPNTKEISYGTGGVDDAEDAEVIWHEYGHSVQDNQVPDFGSGSESGAMGEGFGDYLAGSIGAQLSGGFQDICLAEWDATSYSNTNPPCLRRLDSTKHYPEAIVNEVHADGEIWSATLWEVRSAFGGRRADLLILQHHFLLSPTSTFNQAANALITAARNLGYKTNELKTLQKILTNRGFTVDIA